ncbi:hypothetical protein RFI_32457 [Reticulomyxa filosa]|uniref:Reverse transcriptase domain-containing protein n=1 Tax=Reticulomyxa filosa TaxID=46433 RepID=X6LSR7_RETFI|nr:hypothetical protein RFI_32457 [Reticulomyxa filosa]|eukprot:ETO04938.1 hypothetical protein RFI_32457 [Reticulomyxa filosa]
MRLMWYLNENNLLTQYQARFQSWHNTSELLLRMTESIYSSFGNNGVSYAILLDISSAYDSVWRDGLRNKIRKEFGVKGRIPNWTNCTNGIKSNERKFEVGVPQARIIIVSTVIHYISTIVHSVQDPIQCGMFADDVALWSSIYTSDEKEMERQLDLMQTNPIDHVQDEKQKEIS